MLFKRSDIRICADAKKVILKYLNFGDPATSRRIQAQVHRILELKEAVVDELCQAVEDDFRHRHPNFDAHLNKHFEKIRSLIPQEVKLTPNRKKLLGAYFSMEYSIRAAALFNPSMVAHPDQSGLRQGEKKFIISLRAVGEGHISSIEFRSGIVDREGNISLDEDPGLATTAIPDDSKVFQTEKIKKRTSVVPNFDSDILDRWGEAFTKKDISDFVEKPNASYDQSTLDMLDSLVDSNYDVLAPPNSSLTERVIFPSARQESNGMEDARFVEFMDNGKSTYIGTYTAYDGHRISPQLIITEDFVRFKIRTMYGAAVNDKGFALFPEKVNGQFAMIGRQGGMNLSLMYSDDLFIWENYQTLMTPEDAWGLVQIGNCGSPIKTKEGWLVITHVVGPMRKYTISAILLDLEDPSKIIKKLRSPLISPNESEREGYVPNVVYSCGAMKHGDLLVIPYALSDSACTFGTTSIQELLDKMEDCAV
jgi:predicted GH43/DUF377 family glycosyl hydrolase